jgi:two-component system sensor histidine kinase QseC
VTRVRSVRHRLLLTLASGLLVLLAGAGVLLDGFLRAQATAEFDAALLAQAGAFAALTDEEQGRIELDYRPDSMPEFEREEAPSYFQFWLDDGRVLLRSKRLAADLPRSSSPPRTPATRDLSLPDGRPGRLVEWSFVPGRFGDPGDPADVSGAPPPASGTRRSLVLVVARGRDRLDPLLGRIRLAVYGGGTLVLLLALVLVWRALATGFRPIDVVARQVEGLDADRLGTRVAVPDAPSEVAPVVAQVNALLARLEASFERERRFAGNVAHELRTPIAELRSLAAVAARWPGDGEAVARFFQDVRDVSGHMERIVRDLLLLARCRAGVEKPAAAPTDLRRAIEAAWSRYAAEAARAGLSFRLEASEGLVVPSDPDRLAIVLGNVLGNAVAHAKPGGEVRCAASRAAGRFRVAVENPAEPLTREDLERLTEPFWRKDGARSTAAGSEGHAGLGLALVAALSDLLRMAVRFEQDPDGTFRVVLEGPAPARGVPADLAPAPA